MQYFHFEVSLTNGVWLSGNARLAGFEKDLHLEGYDYNKVLSIFYISYILFEIPSNMLCKIIGPGWYIPAISLGFGVCSIGFIKLPLALRIRLQCMSQRTRAKSTCQPLSQTKVPTFSRSSTLWA